VHRVRSILALILVLAAGPASADYAGLMAALPGLLEQTYGTADVTKQNEEYLLRHNKVLLAGIEGRWVPLSLLGVVEAATPEKACDSKAAYQLQRSSDFGFVMSQYAGTPDRLDYVYVYRAGNNFTVTVHPEKLLHSLGLSPTIANAGYAVMQTLSSASGGTTVARPGKDLLLVQKNLGVPVIFGRCS